jgi:hypothetical protein
VKLGRLGLIAGLITLIVIVSLILSSFYCAFPWSMTVHKVGATASGKGPAPEAERVVLENARVRVLEYTSKPHGDVCGVGTHSHPAHVTIVLSPARDRATNVGGKPEDSDMKVGDVYWSDGETHTDVNTGLTDSRVIVVELK